MFRGRTFEARRVTLPGGVPSYGPYFGRRDHTQKAASQVSELLMERRLPNDPALSWNRLKNSLNELILICADQS